MKRPFARRYDEESDVVVVGGGLAGASFALELVRNGVRVTLLERTQREHLKVCGDFLSGEALDSLDYLGLDARGLGAMPIDRLTLSTAAKSANVPLPFPAAGLSRLCLDEALIARAAAAGVAVRRGVTATGLQFDECRATVATEHATYRAKAAALATGKQNLRGWARPRGSITAFKMQFALSRPARADLAGRVKLIGYEGGHVGACLVESDIATLCWQIDTTKLNDFGADWRAQLATVARRSAVFGDILKDARPVQTRPAAVSSLPFGFIRRTPIADNVFPIGDQMAVIPSFTGDGTSLALSSGVRAARAWLSGKPAGTYQREFADYIRPQFTAASGVSKVMRSRVGRSIGIATIRAMPSLATSLARATRHASAQAYETASAKPL